MSLSNMARACLLDVKAPLDTTSNWNMHSAKFSSSSVFSEAAASPPQARTCINQLFSSPRRGSPNKVLLSGAKVNHSGREDAPRAVIYEEKGTHVYMAIITIELHA